MISWRHFPACACLLVERACRWQPLLPLPPPPEGAAPASSLAAAACTPHDTLAQEMLPQQLAMQMLVGLVYPRAAAAQGLVWAIGRILYTRGAGACRQSRSALRPPLLLLLLLLPRWMPAGQRPVRGAAWAQPLPGQPVVAPRPPAHSAAYRRLQHRRPGSAGAWWQLGLDVLPLPHGRHRGGGHQDGAGHVSPGRCVLRSRTFLPPSRQFLPPSLPVAAHSYAGDISQPGTFPRRLASNR